MGKVIIPNKLEDLEDDELRDDVPGIIPDEDDDVTLPGDGEPVVAADGEEDDDENKGSAAGKAGKGGEGGNGEQPKYTFKSEEELDAFLATRQPKQPATPAATTTPKTETPEDMDEEDKELENLVFFKGAVNEKGEWIGEKPKDWNDFARKIIKYLSPKTYAPKILAEINKLSTKEKQELETINASFDQEYDDLATQGLVPKRDSKEGKEVDAKISTIGGQYGLTSMKAAYELAKKIPVDQGGLLDYKPTTTPKVNPSKQASRLIGSSTQTQNANKGKAKMSYNKLHSARGVDELLDDES